VWIGLKGYRRERKKGRRGRTPIEIWKKRKAGEERRVGAVQLGR
jgi:hypothetical protein